MMGTVLPVSRPNAVFAPSRIFLLNAAPVINVASKGWKNRPGSSTLFESTSGDVNLSRPIPHEVFLAADLLAAPFFAAPFFAADLLAAPFLAAAFFEVFFAVLFAVDFFVRVRWPQPFVICSTFSRSV